MNKILKYFRKNIMTHNEETNKDELILPEDYDVSEVKETEVEPENETASEIETLKFQIQELKNKVLYQQAEFDNFRKRTQREKIEIIQTAARDTMTGILPVLDDFDRAEKISPLTEGMLLIYQKLTSTLKSKGLKEMDASKGGDFNPDEHEAITEVPAGEEFVGKIVDTVEKGYLLGDKIIRHAKVVVGK